jgi:uncharacterized protein
VRRVLVGHSYGGFFTLFAFFHTRPDYRPFQGFVAASPSLQWSSGWIFGREAEVASELSDLPASLYINFGAIEPAFLNAYLDELTARIGSRSLSVGRAARVRARFHSSRPQNSGSPTRNREETG